MVSAGKKSASPVPSGGSPDGTGQWPVPPMVINALSGQAGGGAFVPDGTLDKATRKPSDQSLGYFLSPSGLDGGSPASEGRVAGFGQTGLLAANGSVTFPAFIFKNALAAYIRKGSRLKVSGFRRQNADAQRVARMLGDGVGKL